MPDWRQCGQQVVAIRHSKQRRLVGWPTFARDKYAFTNLVWMSGRKWLLSFFPVVDFSGAFVPQRLQTLEG